MFIAVINMGSTKDLEVLEMPTVNSMGRGRFGFSDRYSVLDWGEMPDHIRNKGASGCAMSAYFFQQVAKLGVPTHYEGVAGSRGLFHTTLDSASEPPAVMFVRLARVLKPESFTVEGRGVQYDYTNVANQRANFVIPIELIYRNSLPRGSSVFRRLKDRSLTLEELGLEKQPEEGYRFPKTWLDGSTKFEKFDRYPGMKELQRISGLSSEEMQLMGDYAITASHIISMGMERAGLSNEDGKFEFAFDANRGIILVDTLGTLDECRICYNGTDISKEIPRQYYRRKQPEWVAEIEAAKKSGAEDWKALVKSRPEPLPSVLTEILSNLYQSVANSVLRRNLFSGVPDLAEIAREYELFKQAEMN